MLKVKDLKFESFSFVSGSRLLNTERSYKSNTIRAILQVDFTSVFNNERVFHARLCIQHALPNKQFRVESQL